jgi:hypothetical protein
MAISQDNQLIAVTTPLGEDALILQRFSVLPTALSDGTAIGLSDAHRAGGGSRVGKWGVQPP